LPYLLQFKQAELIIIIIETKLYHNYLIILTLSNHWAKTATESSTWSTKTSSKTTIKTTEVRSIRVECCSFTFDWCTELIKAYEVFSRIDLVILCSERIIKRVNWVISCSWWNHHVAWNSGLCIVRVAKNLTIRTHIFILSERIGHLRWADHISRWVSSLNIRNKGSLLIALETIIWGKIFTICFNIIGLKNRPTYCGLGSEKLFKVKLIVLYYRLGWIIFVEGYFVNLFWSLVSECHHNLVVNYCELEVYFTSLRCVDVVKHICPIFCLFPVGWKLTLLSIIVDTFHFVEGVDCMNCSYDEFVWCETLCWHEHLHLTDGLHFFLHYFIIFIADRVSLSQIKLFKQSLP